MSSRKKAIIAIIIASMLWGTAGVAGKTLIAGAHPFIISFYRFLIASLCILPFFLKGKPSFRTWRRLMPLSLFGALGVPLFYFGIQTTTANSALLIFTTSPLTTAFLSSILIREIHSTKKLFGIILGLAGAMLIILLPLIEKNGIAVGDFTGNLFIVCSMFCWTLYTIGSKKIHLMDTHSPIVITSIYFFSATLLSFVLAFSTHQSFMLPSLLSPTYIFTLLFSGVFITFITYYLFQIAIRNISVTTASLKQYIELIVGIVLNIFLLRENPSFGFLLGTFFVILGLIIATGSKLFYMVKQKISFFFK